MSIFAQGAVLVPDFVTETEETQILERITARTWSTSIGRRVQHYGYRYDYQRNETLTPADPFPDWAHRLAERLRPWFEACTPVQCIVNEYHPGQGIGMHADHNDFGPTVASVSFASEWPMRFRSRRGQRYARDGLENDEVAMLPRRSALILSAAARNAWMHGIDRAQSRTMTATRVSATFRTVATRAA